MRFSVRLTSVLLLLTTLGSTQVAGQTAPALDPADRVRLVEALRLAQGVCARVWPGWETTAFPILLVKDSLEYLIGHPRPTAEFRSAGRDPGLSGELWVRPRQFPTSFLATFPAVGGIPTVVVGDAGHTGSSSPAWVVVLLHEHFHQWQTSAAGYNEAVAKLDLSGGDSSGMWMLNYPFPYDSLPVEAAMHELVLALGSALDATPGQRPAALADVVAARDSLRARLTPPQYRYLEFQLWQEGVARFVQYQAGRAAAELALPSPAFRALADYQPYAALNKQARADFRRELQGIDLARDRRVSFYSLGAAVAELLEATQPDWKARYNERRFALGELLGR